MIHEILSKIHILNEGVQQVKSGERGKKIFFFYFSQTKVLISFTRTKKKIDSDDAAMDTEFDKAVRLFKTGK